MSLQFKMFTLSAFQTTEVEADINLFLRQHRVLTVHREFVQDQQNSHWNLLIEYLDGASNYTNNEGKSISKNRVDYKDVLSSEDFTVFAKLREWRKQQAEEAGVPVYTIFTNQQLAEMVTLRVTSKTQLREIEGVGEARVKKFGDAIVSILQHELNQSKNENEASG